MKRFGVVLSVWAMGLALILGASAPVSASAQVPTAAAAAAAAVPTAGGFTSVAPSRLLNTLAGVGAPKAVVAAGGIVHLQVTGRGGVPATGVSAVVLNVAVVGPTSSGYITVFGGETPRPGASNLNFVKGQTVPNLVIAPVGGRSGRPVQRLGRHRSAGRRRLGVLPFRDSEHARGIRVPGPVPVVEHPGRGPTPVTVSLGASKTGIDSALAGNP